jgi:hypothetical protein
MAGYSGKPLSQKPGIRPGFRIFVDGLPREGAGSKSRPLISL